MSNVLGIVIIAGLSEDYIERPDGTDELFWLRDTNAWLREHCSPSSQLLSLSAKFGGNKHPQFEMAAAGINHAPTEELKEFIMSYPWKEPEEVALILRPEDGPVLIFRPKSV